MNPAIGAAQLLIRCCLVPGLLSVAAPTLCATPGAGADADQQVLFVGPGRELVRPSEAARVARDGALVEIAAGDYVGDVAVWRQSDLILRGVGPRPHLRAGGKAAEGKAIWVIKGDRVTVENLEFSGTRVPSHNGAGIRAEGAGLTIRNSRLHHNEMGLLTNPSPSGFVLIEDSEFDHNKADTARHGKLGHNIYVHRVRSFVLRDSRIHGAETGHQVKTRAARNEIQGNRIYDGDGASSYLLDIAEGGQAEVSGNWLEQSARASNRTAIAFAAESSDRSSGHSLLVRGNHFVNRGGSGTFVRNHSDARAQLEGNRIDGRGVTPLQGKGTVR